jgi:hypothetical protein
MPRKPSPLTSVRFFPAILVLFHHSVRIFLPVFSSRGIQRVPQDFSGIYLIHTPILALFRHFQWVAPIIYPLYLTLCVGLSLLSFHYFETPARLWLLQPFPRRSLRNTPGTIAFCPTRDLQSL